MAKVPRHFDRLFEGADGVAEGVQLVLHCGAGFERVHLVVFIPPISPKFMNVYDTYLQFMGSK